MHWFAGFVSPEPHPPKEHGFPQNDFVPSRLELTLGLGPDSGLTLRRRPSLGAHVKSRLSLYINLGLRLRLRFRLVLTLRLDSV